MPARLSRRCMGSSLVSGCAPEAFTLIELLVGVAIIALLLSALIPMLEQARSYTQEVVCQNQLRQWGLAFKMYAADNHNLYPHADGLDRDKGPADKFGWVDVLPPLISERPWRDHPLGERPGTGTVFQCGAARLSHPGQYTYDVEQVGFFSYAMNSCLELDEDCWRAPGDGGTAMPSFLRTDLIVKPDQVVLLFDQLLQPKLGYDGKLAYRNAGKHCGSYPKAFSARHNRGEGGLGGSVLYCDDHVEWTSSVWKDSWDADQEVPPRDDPNWFPYPP